MRNGLLCISALRFFTRVSFFFHCNFLTPCRNEVLIALGPIRMLGANKATDPTALPIRRLVKVKPLAGYIGLEKRKAVRPAVREVNVRACSHQENLLLSRCEGEGYAKGLRRFLFFSTSILLLASLRKKLFSRSLSVDELKFHSPARSGGRQITTERAQRTRW